MRNHSKPDKERPKPSRPESGRVRSHKEIDAKKQKQKSFALPAQECIYHDAGSKKSYIDLTESRRETESYSRISVIQSVAAQTSPAAAAAAATEYFQEKPVDFSPKNKYKTEYTNGDSSNLIDIPRQYAAMVV